MLRATLLVAALALAGAWAVPAATAEPDLPSCASTLDQPPSHVWCTVDGSRVDCRHQADGTYDCRAG